MLAYILLCLPIVALSVFSYRQVYNDLTSLTLSNRQSIAYLAANSLKEEFLHLTELAQSFSTRPVFQDLLAEGKPNEAIKLLESVPTYFPEIERLFVADLKGTLLIDTPHLSDVVGENFAQRDWYQGVTREWKPYVSEIYKRTAEPSYNVIAVAVPILDKDQRPMAILVLQVKIDTLTDWSKRVDVGTGGFLYFVDKKGQVAGYARASSEGEILDFSSVAIVQKVLKGQSGIEINFNELDNEERLAAYKPVSDYGWGAIATQPTINAFSRRTETLRIVIAIFGFITFLNFTFVWFLLRFLRIIDGFRERQETFLKSIGDGVMAIDRKFVITLFNTAAERLTGFSPQEAIGRPMRDIVKLVNEKDRTENITFIEEAMLFGKNKEMANGVVLITKTGAEIPVGDSAAPVFDANGVVSGAIIVFRDVSREREIRKMKDEFVSLASHELRTPMTSIAGFVDMMREGRYGQITKEFQEPLGYIAESIDRLIRLVNDLLNVSRIEAGRMKFNLGHVDLGKIASKVVTELQPVAEQKKLELTSKAEEMIEVQADTEKVEQILHNLIGNSLKFTDQGRVTVIVRKDNDFGIIEVVDTGVGIPEDEQKKLFGKFQQIDIDSAGRPSGTGLGLYLSRQLSQKMGGDVLLIESKPDLGSKFALRLPTIDSATAQRVAK